MRFAGLLLLLSPALYCADLSLPGCEPRSEVRMALEREFGPQATQNLTTAESARHRDTVLGRLIAEYPREAAPHLRLLTAIRWNDPERYPGLMAKYVASAQARPNDPLALYLAAMAVFRTHTPEAVRLAEQSRKLAPDFPAPTLLLAEIHQAGKFEDRARAAAELERYLKLCPAVSTLGWTMDKAGTPALRANNAAALRARLEKETDPAQLRQYETLWGMEFRSRPPAQHDELRKVIAGDVKRLERLNPKPDARYLLVLISGYKQSGAPKETITALDNRIVSLDPTSDDAFDVAYDRWAEGHKAPENHRDKAAWDAYNAARLAALDEWIPRFTRTRYLAQMRYTALANNDRSSSSEVLKALDAYLATFEYNEPRAFSYWTAAKPLLDRKIDPARALTLAQRAIVLMDEESAQEDRDDSVSDKDRGEQMKRRASNRRALQLLALRAALMAGRPDAASSFKCSVEAAPPPEKAELQAYWHARARLAWAEGRKADGLAYYQAALHARQEPPPFREGRLRDELGEESKALWQDLGGTETAYAVWSAPPTASGKVESAEGRWERPTRDLPAFELADLEGKTWKLKQLEGKTLLINLWATWCGPCQSELPKLEKLYQQVKPRADLQVLTFNIDDDLGLVAPFMKEKGYTFPVMLAADLVNKLYDGWGIPQNWIVDPVGKWQWIQLGYDSAEADWIGSMLKRLESVKGAAKPR